MGAFAELYTDEKRVAICRADSLEVFFEDFARHLYVTVQRKRYREERDLYPEWVDLGGES